MYQKSSRAINLKQWTANRRYKIYIQKVKASRRRKINQISMHNETWSNLINEGEHQQSINDRKRVRDREKQV